LTEAKKHIETDLEKEIAAKEGLKLRARRNSKRSPLYGLGLFGLVGWSVVVPTLIGAALGSWLDKNHPGSLSWTLNLLIIGLVIGCFNAWFWIQKENRGIDKELEDNGE
jgi:ATP synthase protein I